MCLLCSCHHDLCNAKSLLIFSWITWVLRTSKSSEGYGLKHYIWQVCLAANSNLSRSHYNDSSCIADTGDEGSCISFLLSKKILRLVYVNPSCLENHGLNCVWHTVKIRKIPDGNVATLMKEQATGLLRRVELIICSYRTK